MTASHTAPPPAWWGEAARRLAGSPLVALLDVDGTLAPIVDRPEDAAVPAETRALLRALCDTPGVHVAAVSGRAAADARRMLEVPATWAIGNHGMETIAPDGSVQVDERVGRHRPALGDAIARLRRSVGAMPGVEVEDKAWSASLHYRRAAPGSDRRLRPLVHAVAGEAGLRVTEGKMVLELRPPVEVNKGTAAVALVERLAGSAEPAVLAIGDDRTDEDMFRSLRTRWRDAVTVRVGETEDGAPPETSAEFLVPDVNGVRAVLEALLAARGG